MNLKILYKLETDEEVFIKNDECSDHLDDDNHNEQKERDCDEFGNKIYKQKIILDCFKRVQLYFNTESIFSYFCFCQSKRMKKYI